MSKNVKSSGNVNKGKSVTTGKSSTIKGSKGKVQNHVENDTAPAVQTRISNAPAIVAAMQSRVTNAPNENQRETLKTELAYFVREAFAAQLAELESLGFDGARFATMLGNAPDAAQTGKSNRNEFIAVYSLQKVRKIVSALTASGGLNALDGYTRAILLNLEALGSLNNVDARRSLSSKIERDEMQQVNAIKRVKNCSPATACTQASSTREALRVLGICNVNKGARGDVISYTTAPIAARVAALFMPKGEAVPA